ncbi:MAG: heavy-metal-associated domain-containing protein [Flavobacteriales bacterium]|nr:heavy-metal-associated domain-containing protein [Flavobacteriales bacterium]
MKHTYTISGMTCQSCASKVQQTLSSIEGVQQVDVNLAAHGATIVMETHIETEAMNAALKKAGNYSLTMKGHEMHAASSTMVEDEKENYSFKPLLIVLGFILLLTLIVEYNAGSFDWMRAMRNYMGGFFIGFSFFKLLDLKGFAYSYLSYDIITKKWLGWGFVYPFVELALGIAYLTSFQMRWTLIATVIVMGISSIGVIRAVLDKQKIKCACLGTGFNLPMSTVTIIEDLGMVAMSVIMLFLT